MPALAPSVFSRRWNRFLVPAVLLAAGLPGCMEESEIRTYTIPADEDVMTTERLKSMFAANRLPEFDTPAEWRAAEADDFSRFAFEAGPDDEKQKARITVTKMPPAAGLLVQINRWRGQIGLDPLNDMDASPDVEIMKMGDVDATFVDFDGLNGKSIVGAVAQVSGSMWFFKMIGPTDTVDSETERMRKFCASVRF